MDYKNLKDAIKAVIKKNGAQEITGQIMQDTLLSIVSKLGGNKTFAGVARPTTVPDTTDANIFYIAGENGTYVNFGGAKVENEAAVFVQVSDGTWRAIYTGIQTSHGVNNQLQQEHEYFETEIDKVSADLTQFKQTEFTDVKEDVAGNATEIAKNKSDITKINGEIATLNEATNTAADELVRIEGKVDANLKDAVVVFGPSTNTGVYKGADILSFTNDTPTSTVTAYMSQYWEKLVKLASGKISGSVYAESNNANCTGGSCIGGTQFGYLKIEIEDYQKGGLAGEVLVLSFDSGTERKEMKLTKSEDSILLHLQSYNNLHSVSSSLYNNTEELIVRGSYYIDSNIFNQNDDTFISLCLNVSNVKKIYLKYINHGSAKTFIEYNDGSTEVLKNTFDGILDLSEKKSRKNLYVSSVKVIGIIARVVEVENNISSDLSGINSDIYDYSGCIYKIGTYFSEDGAEQSQTAYVAYIIDVENVGFIELSCFIAGSAKCLLKKRNGELKVLGVDEYQSKKYYIDTASLSGYKWLLVSHDSKNGNAPSPIIKVKEYKYNIIHDLIKRIDALSTPKTLLYNIGDSINKSLDGEEISPNDEYAPSNEMQTLENKPRYKNFAYYLAKRNKLQWYDFAFEKATLTDCKTKAAPDLNCVLTDDAIISMSDQKPDYITLWYGVNDEKFNPIMQRELWLKDKYKAEIAYPMQESEIGKEGYANAEQKAEVDKAVGRVGEVDYDNADSYFFAKFVGTENDEGLTTWCGALNYAFPLLMSEYPTAKIMIIVPDHATHGEMLRKATIKMAEKWGVLYFDLNSLPYWYGSEKTKFENTQHEEMQWLLASGETAAPTVEGFNKSRYSYDGVRPSELGHKVISFPIGNKLING